MRLVNCVNGLLLALAGIMAFVLQERNFLTILAAAYVVVFGLLLFTYELHLECVATCFVSNMGHV